MRLRLLLRPQGFGVAAKATTECRHADLMAIVAFHQGDLGEFLREEDSII